MARVSGNILQPWVGGVNSLKMSGLAKLIRTLMATALKIRVNKSTEDGKAVAWTVASPGGRWSWRGGAASCSPGPHRGDS